MSRSLIFELIQGYGGMHHWVKYCVNRCMKSEVIALTSFVMEARTHRQTHGRTPSISMSPEAMAGDNKTYNIKLERHINIICFIVPRQWLCHGGGQ